MSRYDVSLSPNNNSEKDPHPDYSTFLNHDLPDGAGCYDTSPWLLGNASATQNTYYDRNTDSLKSEGFTILYALADTTLRSIGQVVFLNNPWSGLMILLGLALQELYSAMAVVFCVLLTNVTACYLQRHSTASLPLRDIVDGLYGYNASLVAIGVYLFGYTKTVSLWICGVVVATYTCLLLVCCFRARPGLARFTMTFPFNIAVVWYLIGCSWTVFENVTATTPPSAMSGPPAFSASFHNLTRTEAFFLSLPTNVGQIYFADYWVSGLFIWLACFFHAPSLAWYAALGSVVGSATSLALGVPQAQLASGLWGFSQVLNAMHVAVSFAPRKTYGDTLRAHLWVIALCIACTYTTGTLRAVFSKVGVPAFTLPFCVTAVPYTFVRSYGMKMQQE